MPHNQPIQMKMLLFYKTGMNSVKQCGTM